MSIFEGYNLNMFRPSNLFRNPSAHAGIPYQAGVTNASLNDMVQEGAGGRSLEEMQSNSPFRGNLYSMMQAGQGLMAPQQQALPQMAPMQMPQFNYSPFTLAPMYQTRRERNQLQGLLG